MRFKNESSNLLFFFKNEVFFFQRTISFIFLKKLDFIKRNDRLKKKIEKLLLKDLNEDRLKIPQLKLKKTL